MNRTIINCGNKERQNKKGAIGTDVEAVKTKDKGRQKIITCDRHRKRQRRNERTSDVITRAAVRRQGKCDAPCLSGTPDYIGSKLSHAEMAQRDGGRIGVGVVGRTSLEHAR